MQPHIYRSLAFLLAFSAVALGVVGYEWLPAKVFYFPRLGRDLPFGVDKFWVTYLPAGIILAMTGLFFLFHRTQSHKEQYQDFRIHYARMDYFYAWVAASGMTLLFLAAYYHASMKACLGLVGLYVGAVTSAVGLVLKTCPPGFGFGLKNSYTKAHPDIWIGVHDLCGDINFYSGLGLIALAWAAPYYLLIGVSLVTILAALSPRILGKRLMLQKMRATSRPNPAQV